MGGGGRGCLKPTGSPGLVSPAAAWAGEQQMGSRSSWGREGGAATTVGQFLIAQSGAGETGIERPLNLRAELCD